MILFAEILANVKRFRIFYFHEGELNLCIHWYIYIGTSGIK